MGQPAFGRFERANLQVMLSRTPDADSTRILRLLPFKKFAGLRIDADLLHELQRLERASQATLAREGAL